MYPNDAIDYLEKMPNRSDKLALLVITENEIRQVTGDRYPTEDLDRLIDLISRTPHEQDDIDANYWYEQNGIFRKLLEAGIEYIEDRKVKDEVNTRNNLLTMEMGLKNIQLSLNKEIRPMRVVNEDGDVPVYNCFSDKKPWFTLPQGKTYGDLLLVIDAHKRGDGHHIYLEDMEAKYMNAVPALYVGFGS